MVRTSSGADGRAAKVLFFLKFTSPLARSRGSRIAFKRTLLRTCETGPGREALKDGWNDVASARAAQGQR